MAKPPCQIPLNWENKQVRYLAVATLLLLSAATAAHAAAPPPDRVILPAEVTPTHYDIRIVPDAAQLSFTASVKIDLEVAQPTRRIVLNAADLKFSKVTLSDAADAPTVAFDPEQQTATLTFAAPVGAGPHVLSIDYSGKIYQNTSGLFALDYSTPQGQKRALFTQFENSDARRFFPCWDEPARKATFTLTATVPAADMPISNMPVASTDTLDGGLKRVHFADSPKMSSYLLFFGSGDFERISRIVDGVDVGVVVKHGDTAQAQYALDTAAQILPYYEDYFGVKYPLPKLDLIAGPGQSQFFGAMENWGAIFYFERDLLNDPKITTDFERIEIYTVIAHEMAHQWFGDLVTMQWWDDLWLNEGFASWMELKASDHFHPEWKMWLLSQHFKEQAMSLDARKGTHPIITPIRDVQQAAGAFDDITYEKGGAVIRMLEDYVGEDAFRAGVRAYMQAHAYGNTVTDDLWRELDRTTSVSITDIAHQFTRQEGVPLIRATADSAGVRLTQDRFTDSGPAADKMLWQAPVTARWIGAQDSWHGLVARDKPARITGKPGDGLVVNAGQSAYLRTLYAPALVAPLAAHFPELSAADQLGLLYDTQALGHSGYEPMSDFLELAEQAKPGMDPTVLVLLTAQLEDIDHLYDRLPGQARFRAFGRGVLEPIFASVGWTPQAGESTNTGVLRQSLIAVLGRFDDPDVLSGARSRFADFLKDPASLSAELRHGVLGVVAEHADAATWEQLHQLARNAGSSLEKADLYGLLGTARDPALVQRALQLALSDEPEVTVRPSLLTSAAKYSPEPAFDFANAHFDQVDAMLEPTTRNAFVPRLAAHSTDAAIIPKLRAYAQAHIPADARKDAMESEMAIASAVKFRKQRLPDVDRWLARHAAAKSQAVAGQSAAG